MESGSKGKKPAPGSLGQSSGSVDCRYIEEIIRTGGQIMIGSAKPIRHAAVAHDGTSTLAMLRFGSTESLESILRRLDEAIHSAKATGERVDEINIPESDTRFKYR